MIEIKKKINCVFEAAEYLCRRGSGKVFAQNCLKQSVIAET